MNRVRPIRCPINRALFTNNCLLCLCMYLFCIIIFNVYINDVIIEVCREGISQKVTKHDRGRGGVQKSPKLHDIIYAQP